MEAVGELVGEGQEPGLSQPQSACPGGLGAWSGRTGGATGGGHWGGWGDLAKQGVCNTRQLSGGWIWTKHLEEGEKGGGGRYIESKSSVTVIKPISCI